MQQPQDAQSPDQRVGDDQAAEIDDRGGDHQPGETGQPDHIRIDRHKAVTGQAPQLSPTPAAYRCQVAAAADGREPCGRPGMTGSEAMVDEIAILEAMA